MWERKARTNKGDFGLSNRHGICDRCKRHSDYLSEYGNSKFLHEFAKGIIKLPKWLCENCSHEWDKIYVNELVKQFPNLRNLNERNELWLRRFKEFIKFGSEGVKVILI